MDIIKLVGLDERLDKAFEDAIEETVGSDENDESYSFGELMNEFMRKAFIKIGFPEELYDKPFSEFTEEEEDLMDQFVDDVANNHASIFRKE